MDWLNSLYYKVEAQKLQIEQTTRSLQSLFKPWPAPEQEPKPDAESVSEDAKDKPAVKSDTNENLTEEEKEGVNLVDKLLLKAQKARQVQQKLEESKRSRPQKDALAKIPNSTNKDQLKTEKDVCSKNGFVQENIPTKQIDKTRDKLISATAVYQNKKDSCLDKSRKDTCSVKGIKHANSSGQSICQNKKASVTDSNLKPVNNSGSKGCLKDQQGVRRSTGKRVTPAHVSAPFQTNPRLVNSKLKSEYGSSTGRVLSAVKNSKDQTGKVKGAYSAPGQRTTSKCQVKSQDHILSNDVPKLCTRVVKDKTRNMDTELHSLSTDSSKHSHIYEDDHGGCDTDTLMKTDPSKADKPEQVPKEMEITGGLENLEIPEELGFRLLKDGHSLSIPCKYRKLAGINRKLKQKLFNHKVTTKVDSPQPNKEFPLQLQQRFEDPFTQKLQMTAKQATYLVNVYKNLADLLESLNLQTLDGDSSIEAVLMARKNLEYILSNFHETEAHLHSVDVGILKSVLESQKSCRRAFQEPIFNSSVIWNSVANLGHNQPRYLKYRSFRQLERYTSLLHRIQLLQFQIDSMDKIAEQTLPLLQSLNPTSSDFIQVLRCSYSMLSTNPNRVPVIVRDTIQDDAEIQDTHIT